jgi:riboflavin kinase
MMEGKIRSGRGEGKKYIGMEVYQKAFQEILGYRPFPGTLNLEVDEEEREKFEKRTESEEITDVYRDGDRLSDVDVFPCRIEGIECAALNLEKTDHPYSILEVVAPVELREKLSLEDGDTVRISKE